jgi:AbrB family looped-hinge helix DNA binding protein
MKSVVGEKGQVTIPKALRRSLGIVPGTELEFEESNGTLVARRVIATDPLSALLGIVPTMNTDAALADMRGPRWSAELDEPGK